MRDAVWRIAAMLVFAAGSRAEDFATPGRAGSRPTSTRLRTSCGKDAYDLELLISFGTSKGGSAGHLALAIRDQAPGDDLVYSANFYADRKPEHAKDRYTDDLMVRIPKMEYLYRTASSLGDKAAFGLDFGEIYKRSVVGVRVYGVPAAEKEALLAAFFARINEDFHKRARNTEYHDEEVSLRLPAPELRQDHRGGVQVRCRVHGPQGQGCKAPAGPHAGRWPPPAPTSPPRWR